MKPKPALTLLVSSLVAVSSALGQQLVQNPGFETGDFTGWTLSGNSGFLSVSTNLLYAHSGTFGAQMGPQTTLGYISQTIPTVPGQMYYISCWFDRPDGMTPNQFQITWNGTNIHNPINITALGWTNLEFTNIATQSNTVLRFGFRNDPSFFGLDDITVCPLGNAAGSVAAYTYSTLAGFPAAGSADGTGSQAQFQNPFGAAVDASGNIYVADTGNATVRMITPSGVVTTIAGYPQITGSSDGEGSDARFFRPRGVAVDNGGDVFVADTFNRTIRRMTLTGTNWSVTTIAGSAGIIGTNDGVGTNAQFNTPEALAVDSATNVYVADFQQNTIRKIALVGTNWITSTIAGRPAYGAYGSTDGTNQMAEFSGPKGVAVDASTNLYISDSFNATIRKITPSGTNWVTTTLAGQVGQEGTSNGVGTNAQFSYMSGIAVDSVGNLYVADTGYDTIRKIVPTGTNWNVSTLAGTPSAAGSADGTGSGAEFNGPDGVVVDHSGNIYVADTGNNEIRKVTSAGVVATFAGSAPGDSVGSGNGVGSQARFNNPLGAAVDAFGNIYVADAGNNAIRQITPAGLVSLIAGSPGNPGTNDGIGSDANFRSPGAVAVDGSNNVYVADSGNNTIRLLTAAGVVTTIAGQPGNIGTNDGIGNAAQFNGPNGLAVDGFGNIFVTDSENSTIRKIRLSGTNWMVSTIAGIPGADGRADGTNAAATFSEPYGIATDLAGNVYVSDQLNSTIRKLTPSGTNWVTSTIAGTADTTGTNDGTGGSAQFYFPAGLAADQNGALYVADYGNSTLRRMTPQGASWTVNTIGGSPGTPGSADGAGGAALFNFPAGIAVDAAGDLYVVDTHNNVIRQGVFAQFGAVSAVSVPPPVANGQITVTLLPPAAGGQWRFPWELSWRNSGATATNLVSGEYPIEFSDVAGYFIIPFTNSVNLPAGGAFQVTNVYYPTISASNANNGSGTLTVNIGPSPPAGAGWTLSVGSGSYLPPGYSTNLVANNYLVQFAPVGGFITPPTLSVPIAGGEPTTLQVTYQLSQSPPRDVALPVPVPSGDIADLTDYPFGFNGQLETDVGFGSGVAIETNVVLTAAHVIFNDQTLSYSSQAYWFFEQETGVFPQIPLPARGWYVLSGYAAQRTNDLLGGLAPDESSPQSRNFDVAALYFLSPVANGGYGGYLSSDVTPNQWLASAAEKMLVGYPVDGSELGFTNIVNGTMYMTGPQPYPLTLSADPVGDQQVYDASWFLSYPGNSGGPLYVQLNGYYYPAGVYLGTLYNGIVPYASVVRAIDSNVVSLITLAAALGDTGTNGSGGGIITIIPSVNVSHSNPGYLVLQLGPPSAVQAGAAWELAGQPANFYSTANPSLQEITTTNALALQFKPIPGWNLPTNQSVTVFPGAPVTNFALYTVTNPVLTVNLAHGLSISGTTNTTYQIQSNSSLTGPWIPFLTNTLTNFNFNLLTNHPRPGYYRAVWLTN